MVRCVFEKAVLARRAFWHLKLLPVGSRKAAQIYEKNAENNRCANAHKARLFGKNKFADGWLFFLLMNVIPKIFRVSKSRFGARNIL